MNKIVTAGVNESVQVHDSISATKIVNTKVTETCNVTSTASADTRVNLSIPHLLSAYALSRRVKELENTYKGHEFGDFWHDILANATGSIFTAVSALESYANEIFIDYEKSFHEIKPPVMAKLWELFEQKSILEKYEFALLIKEAEAFNRGQSPYQDIKKIIQLRNGLIHFKPEWFSAQKEHAKLSKALEHKATLSPFFSERERLFPRGWASYQTLQWVINSCVNFLLEFEQKANLPPKMGEFSNRFEAI